MLSRLRSPHNVAGLLWLLAAALVAAIWYVLFFVSVPSEMSVADASEGLVGYLFSAENPSRPWFIWLAVAPVVSAALGLAYLFGVSRSTTSAVALFSVAFALAVTAFYFVTWSLAVFVALPCYWGYLCVRKAP